MRQAAVTVTAVTVAAAAGIHLAVGVEHGLTGIHGTFFVVVGVAQAALALAVTRRATRRLLAAVSVLNAAIAVTWATAALSSTSSATDPLAVAATSFEVVAVVAALAVLRSPATTAARRPRLAALALAALVAAGAAGLASPVDAHVHEAPLTPAAGAPSRPIFGDLFADHHGTSSGGGDHHGAAHEHDAAHEQDPE